MFVSISFLVKTRERSVVIEFRPGEWGGGGWGWWWGGGAGGGGGGGVSIGEAVAYL